MKTTIKEVARRLVKQENGYGGIRRESKTLKKSKNSEKIRIRTKGWNTVESSVKTYPFV